MPNGNPVEAAKAAYEAARDAAQAVIFNPNATDEEKAPGRQVRSSPL